MPCGLKEPRNGLFRFSLCHHQPARTIELLAVPGVDRRGFLRRKGDAQFPGLGLDKGHVLRKVLDIPPGLLAPVHLVQQVMNGVICFLSAGIAVEPSLELVWGLQGLAQNPWIAVKFHRVRAGRL